MPRWLLVSVLALWLSCFGFGAAAQNPASDDWQQGCASQVQASSASPIDDHAAADPADASTAPGEAAADQGLEAIGNSHEPFVPVLLSEPTPRPAATQPPSPALERLQRPPRGGAYVA